MRNKVFLDTAFIIALSMEKDALHEEAMLLSEEIETQKNPPHHHTGSHAGNRERLVSNRLSKNNSRNPQFIGTG
jgi:predicted nucleic acid-binding protein